MARSPNRLLGLVVGAVYLVLGALGLITVGGHPFFGTTGGLLLGVFEVNAAQNIVHLLFGAALAMAAVSSVAAAKTVAIVVGTVCLIFGIVGLFLTGSDANIFALNAPDQTLHFATAVVLLAAGLGADRVQRESRPLN
jgi:hypothetical protein